MAIHLDQPTVAPGSSLRQWWTVIALLLVTAIFMQAVFAGAMLSGIEWALRAHRLNGMILIGSTGMAGLLALFSLRHVAHGSKLGFTLLALAAVTFVQAAIGMMSAKGANLMWVHVPLGVALVGFAIQAVRQARSLGQA